MIGLAGKGREMAGRPTILNAAVLRELLENLRSGAFDGVAAEAAGVSRRTFYRWLQLGRSGKEPFVRLEEAVRQAKALARLGAERRVREQQPLSWLRLGPGRERRGEPGWAGPVQAQDEAPAETAEPDDPENLQALAEALVGVGLEAWEEEQILGPGG
jgi:hypothetical protein